MRALAIITLLTVQQLQLLIASPTVLLITVTQVTVI